MTAAAGLVIVADLLTPFEVEVGGRRVRRWIVGGLLGHWAVWTRPAVELLEAAKRVRAGGGDATALLALGVRVTDANAALFDPAHGFKGCIPGLHEVLRRQGLLEGRWCLDPDEVLSPGQLEEIDRVQRDHPELNDDAFVRQNLARWLA